LYPLKIIAVVGFGALVLGCTSEAPSARVTIAGSSAEVERFVAAENARSPRARVDYRSGANEATFAVATSEEAVQLGEDAIKARLSVLIESGG